MSIFIALLLGALVNISTGAPVTPNASRSKEPFTERDVIFSIASFPPTALTCLSKMASTVGSAAAFASAFGASDFGISVFPVDSALGFSCAAVVRADNMAMARISEIRFIRFSLSELLFFSRLANLFDSRFQLRVTAGEQ
jgi:hypothetical protein